MFEIKLIRYTYGNRDYDDSLLELKTILQSQGFIVIAAAAFVTEHVVIPKFGAGRPNEQDAEEIKEFAALVKNKIAAWNKISHTDLTVKGSPIYRKYKSIPIKPHVKPSCVMCGLCAEQCPANAIPTDNFKITIKNKCVTCMRCVRICPQKARDFYGIEKFFAEKSLAKKCRVDKRNEIFI